jgi:UDP-glucose 4-epimerase
MKVVVTGATGNVGTSLVRALSADPLITEIVGLSRRGDGPATDKTRWVAGDVSKTALEPIFDGADAVVHLAWLIQPSREPDLLHEVNVVGSRKVFDAAARSGVATLLYMSSVGAYSPAPHDTVVDESWPTGGIVTSDYSVHKAWVERGLDEVEASASEMRVIRLRPGLIFKRSAGAEIARYFLGSPAIAAAALKAPLPLLPYPKGLRFEAVHTDDLAQACRLALLSGSRGAFNIASGPPVTRQDMAELLGAKRSVGVGAGLVRSAVRASWKAHVQPTDPGWIDMAMNAPLMDVGRAQRELGWTPKVTAVEATRELLDGIRHAAD